MTPPGVSERQVTLLPAQLRRLASLAEESSGTIGITQDVGLGGSVLQIQTGSRTLYIDATGQDLQHPNQEPLL